MAGTAFQNSGCDSCTLKPLIHSTDSSATFFKRVLSSLNTGSYPSSANAYTRLDRYLGSNWRSLWFEAAASSSKMIFLRLELYCHQGVFFQILASLNWLSPSFLLPCCQLFRSELLEWFFCFCQITCSCCSIFCWSASCCTGHFDNSLGIWDHIAAIALGYKVSFFFVYLQKKIFNWMTIYYCQELAWWLFVPRCCALSWTSCLWWFFRIKDP